MSQCGPATAGWISLRSVDSAAARDLSNSTSRCASPRGLGYFYSTSWEAARLKSILRHILQDDPSIREEVLDSRLGGSVGVLDRQTYRGGTRGSRLCGGDRDRETENSKVRARTRNTRFIQVRTAKVASRTSCLGDQVWRPALGVGCPRRDWDVRLGTRPSFI
jgi:hypothetical protein